MDTRGLEGSTRVIAGRRVGSRRASIDVPAPEEPSSRMFGSQRLHDLQLQQGLWECRRVPRLTRS